MSILRRISLGFTIIITTLFTSTTLQAEVIDTVIAVVSDDPILASELDTATNLYMKSNKLSNLAHKVDDSLMKQVRSEVITYLIDEKIIEQEAERFGITYTPEEVDTAIDHIKELNNCSSLDRVLECGGVSISDLRQNLQKQILKNKLIDKHIYPRIVITYEKIKEYYDNNFHIYDGTFKYHLYSVLVEISNPNNLDESVSTFTEIFNILQELDSGSSFDYISKIYLPVDHVNIEYIGTFSENELSDRMKKSMPSLDVGRNSKIMKTNSGFQFFHVKEIIKTAPQPLETVKNEIYKKLLSEEANYEFVLWLNSVKKRSNIKLFLDNF